MSDDRSYKLFTWRLLRVVTTYIEAVGGWCCLLELYLSAAALLSPKAVLGQPVNQHHLGQKAPTRYLLTVTLF
jgi:hypothetical protein